MIKLISNNSYGELYVNGEIATDSTLHTAIFISLFGGNKEANSTTFRQPKGTENKDWFGNLFQLKSGYPLYNSQFERSFKNNALISGNIKVFENAIIEDLDWLIKDRIAESITPFVFIKAQNRIKVEIQIKGTQENYKYLFEVEK